MKKALVILLAVAMMFCFSATAFAAQFNDIDDCSAAGQDAISKVTALGIVEGYDDGGYHPDEAITRAEFAKMAVIAAGLGDAAEDLTGVSPAFSDVKVSEWYTGWINMAASQGYVIGYTNGTYGPNNDISYAEVTTVLMRLLGYNDNLTGPWPINYINQATKLDILDDVQGFSANAAATRENVAIMLSAALDQDMVKWIGDPFNDFIETTDPATTLLEDSFKGNTTSVTAGAVSVTDEENGEYQIGSVDADMNTVVVGVEPSQLEGREVTIITDKDDLALYVQVDDELVAFDEATDKNAERDTIKLDGKTYDYVAQDSAITNLDEAGYALINSDDEIVEMGDAATMGPKYLGTYDLVTDVDTSDEDAYTVTINDDEDIDANADDVIFVQNGDRVTAEDIEAGDVLVDTAVDGMYAVIDNPSVTGTVTDYATGSVYVDDVEYTYTSATIYDDEYAKTGTVNGTKVEDWYDDAAEITVYVGSDNNVFAVIDANEATVDNYGVVLDRELGGWNNNEATALSIYTTAGKTINYTVNAKDADQPAIDALTEGAVISFETNSDDEITSVKALTKTGKTDYEVYRNRYVMIDNDQVPFASNAVVMNMGDDYEMSLIDVDDVLAGDEITAATAEDTAYDTDAAIFYKTNEDGEIEFMVVTNFGATTSAEYAVVDNVTGTKITLDGTTYNLKDGVTVSDTLENQLVSYELTGGEVSKVEAVTGYANSDTAKAITKVTGDVMTIDGVANTVSLADDCVFFALEDGEFTASTQSKVVKAGNNVKYILDADEFADGYNVAELVVWVK